MDSSVQKSLGPLECNADYKESENTRAYHESMILHVDADAFFASVEQALDPSLKGRKVIVGGTNRGVVSAASYEARKFGVRSAMPVAQARRLCPDAVFLSPNFKAYKEYSNTLFDIIDKYSPLVERTSVDEGYVDLGGTLKLHRAPPWEIAHRILCEIRESLDINCSGGLACSRTFAKMATNLAKPNGLIYLSADNIMKIMGNMPAAAIPGIGRKAEEKLRRNGILTVRDLTMADPEILKNLLGAWAEKLVEKISCVKKERLSTREKTSQKSYSKDRTLAEDTYDYEMVKGIAGRLLEGLAQKLRSHQRAAATITLKIKYKDFSRVSKSITLKQATNINTDLLDCLERLFPRTITKGLAIRQVGVSLSGVKSPMIQMNLFDMDKEKMMNRDILADVIRDKYGFDAIMTR